MCIALSIRLLTLRHMALRARRPACTEALRAQLCVRIFTLTLLLTHCGQGSACSSGSTSVGSVYGVRMAYEGG